MYDDKEESKMRKLILILMLLPVVVIGQELTITAGDTVGIVAEQVTQRSDNTPLSFGDRIFYTLRVVHGDGLIEILGGIDHSELSYPADGILKIQMQTEANDKIGTHKIQGFHHRKPVGSEGVEYLSEMTELTLIVTAKQDTLPGKAWKVIYEML